MSNGKGSNRRPMQIPPEEFAQRWAETFGLLERQMRDGRILTPLERLEADHPGIGRAIGGLGAALYAR